ncbi:MAG: aminotransferase [Kangiella sp.]|nr:MAG: aminotransferase [Kangiella sp.]
MTLQNHISSSLRKGKHSETLLINQLSQERVEKDQKVYKLGFGQSPFPVPTEITQQLKRAANRKEYTSVQGLQELRQAICDFHRAFENKDWKPEQIIVAGGSKILLFCIMSAFKKAEILLPAPSWVSYEPQGKLAGHEVNWIETTFDDKWSLTAKQLDDYCISRNKDIPLILVFNYPSNPTGQTYNANQLSDLAYVMRKHKVIVIADEIYSLLTYKKGYPTLSDYYPEGCIVSSGLSKWCGAGGWRLGFHYIPKELGEDFKQAVISVASETYSCAPTPIQVAAIYAYRNMDEAKIFLDRQKRVLNQISQYITQELNQINITTHVAQGGFYLFPDFSHYRAPLENIKIYSGEDLTERLMNEIGVALLPGSAFGMAKDSLTARLAFVDFDGSQIFSDDLDHRDHLEESNSSTPFEFNKIKEGIKILCEWFSKLN